VLDNGRCRIIVFRVRKVLRVVQNKYMSTCREMKLDFMSDDSAYIIHNVELRLEVNKVLCVFEFKLL